MRYLAWENVEEWDRWARVAVEPEAIRSESFKLTTGVPADGVVPDALPFDVSPEFGVELADSIPNSVNLRLVSARLLALFASAGVAHQAFPITVRNARGRVEAEPYFVLNILEQRACADLERSLYGRALIRGRIARIRRLVLDPSRIEPPTAAFRLAECPQLVLVREDLAARIETSGMTGLRLETLEDYGRAWRRPGE